MNLLRNRLTGSKPPNSEQPVPEEFVWPPPPSAGEVIYLDPKANQATEEPFSVSHVEGVSHVESVTPVESVRPGECLWLEHLLARGVQFEWHDAVAIVLQLIEQLNPTDGQEPDGSFPSVDRIALEPAGTLFARLEREGAAPVLSLGQLLLQLLAGRDTPAALRLLIIQAAAPTPTLLFVSDFTRELARWERPRRREKLTELYERARKQLNAPEPPLLFPAHAPSTTRSEAMAPLMAPPIPAPPTATTQRQDPMGARQRPRRSSPLVLLAVITAGSVGVAALVVLLLLSAPTLSGSPDAASEVAETNVELQEPAPGNVGTARRGAGVPGRAAAATRPTARASASVATGSRTPTPPPVRSQTPAATTPSTPVEQPGTQAGLATSLPPQVARATDSRPINPVTLVPIPVQDAFNRARQLFEERQYAEAADGFVAVVQMLEREDPTFDLRWTANEFAAVSRVLASQSGGQAERVYVSTDPDVTEPVALAPSLPPPVQPGTPADQLAMLELIIDGRGAVESARYVGPAQHYRDRWWISAAKSWLFKPATRNGQPVKYLKRIVFVDGAALAPP